MDTRKKKALKALAVSFAFSLAQVYVQAGLPRPATPASPPQQPSPPKPIIGTLTTTGNGLILVNGTNVNTGASILTGAMIETPDDVDATIFLGEAGVIGVKRGSTVQLDWNENGTVRVNLIEGCVVAKKKSNVLLGEIELITDTGCQTTDQNRRELGYCMTWDGELEPFSDPRLTTGEITGIGGGIAGPTILVGVLLRGENPSPTAP